MRDELLALLEDGPHPSAELACWLAAPAGDVHRFLLGLARAGEVKRVGSRQEWALPSHVAVAGRKMTINRDACRLAIVTALARGPLPTEVLVLETRINRHTIKHECALMRDAGELRNVGKSRGSRWLLPGWVAPTWETFRAEPPVSARPQPQTPTVQRQRSVPQRQDAPVPTTKKSGLNVPNLKTCKRCGKSFDGWSQHRICPACRDSTVVFASKRAVPRTKQELAAVRVEELLLIEESSPGVTLVCPGPGCGKRFQEHRAVDGRFCSTACAIAPRPTSRTVIVAGVEYEAISIGAHSISSWPGADAPFETQGQEGRPTP